MASTINTNIASLISQSNLSRTSNDLITRLQRLSTGLRSPHPPGGDGSRGIPA